MKSQLVIITLFVSLWLIAGTAYASDHDDGEMELKGRNVNLTDLYAFREDWQDSRGRSDQLVLVMNTNPRSLARQEYSFSSVAAYDFHLSRVRNKKAAPTPGTDDYILRFEFGEPQGGLGTMRQQIFLTIIYETRGSNGAQNQRIVRGKTSIGTTTSLGAQPIVNVDQSTGITVFAGLREDPFFFDVERYFRVRSYLATKVNTLGSGPTQSAANPFRSDATAIDFTAGYNVNAIVARIPLSVLGAQIFDVWETISVPLADTPWVVRVLYPWFGPVLDNFLARFGLRNYVQIERLARPAINEGLVLTNDSLNAFNAIAPYQDLTDSRAEATRQEAKTALSLVRQYASSVGLQPPTEAAVIGGFFPDVMRIDVAASITVGKWGYNGDFVVNESNAPTLTGGRKLEDDVMDLTLSYLFAGVNGIQCGPTTACAIKDGVSYAGTPGNVGNPGHKLLFGQGARNGSATFPFLADPN